MAPRKSPKRKQSPVQKAKNAFVSKKLKSLRRKSPRAKQTTLMKRANAAWMKSPQRRKLMGGRKSPAKRKSPARKSSRKSPKRKSPSRGRKSPARRRTPLQVARKRFLKAKRAELQKASPKSKAAVLNKRANKAWMNSPERRALMDKRAAKVAAKQDRVSRKVSGLRQKQIRFVRAKKAELRRQYPNAKAATLDKKARAAWKRSPERKQGVTAERSYTKGKVKASPALKALVARMPYDAKPQRAEASPDIKRLVENMPKEMDKRMKQHQKQLREDIQEKVKDVKDLRKKLNNYNKIRQKLTEIFMKTHDQNKGMKIQKHLSAVQEKAAEAEQYLNDEEAALAELRMQEHELKQRNIEVKAVMDDEEDNPLSEISL